MSGSAHPGKNTEVDLPSRRTSRLADAQPGLTRGLVRAPSDRSDSSVVRRREIVRVSPVVSKPAKLTTGAQAQEGFQKFKSSQPG